MTESEIIESRKNDKQNCRVKSKGACAIKKTVNIPPTKQSKNVKRMIFL
jgi:hypothetical protein